MTDFKINLIPHQNTTMIIVIIIIGNKQHMQDAHHIKTIKMVYPLQNHVTIRLNITKTSRH